MVCGHPFSHAAITRDLSRPLVHLSIPSGSCPMHAVPASCLASSASVRSNLTHLASTSPSKHPPDSPPNLISVPAPSHGPTAPPAHNYRTPTPNSLSSTSQSYTHAQLGSRSQARRHTALGRKHLGGSRRAPPVVFEVVSEGHHSGVGALEGPTVGWCAVGAVE
jgi:hypothetical protein